MNPSVEHLSSPIGLVAGSGSLPFEFIKAAKDRQLKTVVIAPPTEIGHHVAAALVGTMLGILLSYGYCAPLATKMDHIVREQTAILKTVKAGLVSFAGGAPPQVALEFARKTIPSSMRPSAEELEEILKEAKKA